jgi:glycosyltransferase involved in cell wall biosynthesis
MTSLSAVIITLNEEKNIANCINSLRTIADEIIVVDSWSSDNTPLICTQKGVRFFQTDWQGYAATKNYANSLAQFPLILSIDADEVLSNELKESILSVKMNPQFDGYKINIRTNYCGHWLLHLRNKNTKIRLFFKGKANWIGPTVNEELKMKIDCTVGHLNGDLLHFACRTVRQHLANTHKYTTLKAIQAQAEGKEAHVYKVILGPFKKFIVEYLFKKGILDGYYGFIACCVMAFGYFVQYVKLHELNNNHPL